MLSLEGIDHIAIAMHDLEEGIEFFNKLGFLCKKREIIHERNIKIAFIDVFNILIELISPLSDKSEISKFLKIRGNSIHHIAFKTNNILDGMRYLKSKGLNFIYNKPKDGSINSTVNFINIKDSKKILIELVERK